MLCAMYAELNGFGLPCTHIYTHAHCSLVVQYDKMERKNKWNTKNDTASEWALVKEQQKERTTQKREQKSERERERGRGRESLPWASIHSHSFHESLLLNRWNYFEFTFVSNVSDAIRIGYTSDMLTLSHTHARAYVRLHTCAFITVIFAICYSRIEY